MSKLLPFLVAGVGASSVSVGGVFMLKKTGGEGGSQNGKSTTGSSPTGNGTSDQAPSQTDTSKKLDFDSLDKFHKNGGQCVKELFEKERDLSSTTGNPTDVDFSTIATTLNPASSENQSKNQSCLIINYEKKGEDSKGTGTFTWTWAFAHETKGFVIFGLAKTPTPSTTEKKITFEGGVYLLSKEGGSEWAVKHKTEVTSSNVKKVEQAQFDEYFPKPATGFKDAQQSYGGFISNASDVGNICSDNTCSTTPLKTYREWWKGTGQDAGDKKPHEWSENMNWFKNIFGDSAEKLKGHLDTLTVSGQGTKQTTTPA